MQKLLLQQLPKDIQVCVLLSADVIMTGLSSVVYKVHCFEMHMAAQILVEVQELLN